MIANLQAHWGFTTMPFGRDIAVDHLFGARAHNEAVARLRYLISARGLGVLTGEVGLLTELAGGWSGSSDTP